eukprot:COSAG01_NODE_34777_length_542_cov_0.993228_1_plen_65_part_10
MLAIRQRLPAVRTATAPQWYPLSGRADAARERAQHELRSRKALEILRLKDAEIAELRRTGDTLEA